MWEDPTILVLLDVAKGSGSGGNVVDLNSVCDNTISGDVVITATSLRTAMLADCTHITSVSCPNAVTSYGINISFSVRDGQQFARCTSLRSVSMPVAENINLWYGFVGCTSLVSVSLPKLKGLSEGIFSGCSALQVIALPSSTGVVYANAFYGCSALKKVDLNAVDLDRTGAFNGCTVLDTLIIRKSSAICKLGNLNNFTSTPFDSGGTGGTIYIPEALYDHLGDGTALDYKAATNWSTLDAYGTITWAKIEGSQYETEYADGTPVSA